MRALRARPRVTATSDRHTGVWTFHEQTSYPTGIRHRFRRAVTARQAGNPAAITTAGSKLLHTSGVAAGGAAAVLWTAGSTPYSRSSSLSAWQAAYFHARGTPFAT